MGDRLSVTSDLIFFFRRRRGQASDENALVFKVPLTNLMNEVPPDKRGGDGDGLTGAYAIPYLLVDIADAIRRRSGLDEEGIFRVSAASSTLRSVKDTYNQADPVDIEAVDVHTLACILKLFFRDLPQPLIPTECYPAFIALAETSFTKDYSYDPKKPPGWIIEMKALVAQLPHPNRLLLNFLMQLLADVVAHKDKNKMDAHNLGIVFGPALLQPTQEDTPARDSSSGSEPNTPSDRSSLTNSFCSMTNLSLTMGEAKVVMLMIQYYPHIFGNGFQWVRGQPPLRPGEDIISSARREAAGRIMLVDQHLEEEEQQWRERERQEQLEAKRKRKEEREKERQRLKEQKEAKRKAKRAQAQSKLAPSENYGTLGRPQVVTENVPSFPIRSQAELEVCCNCCIS